jgi:hypothetical protein
MHKGTIGSRMRQVWEEKELSQEDVGEAMAKAVGRRRPWTAAAVGLWASKKPPIEVVVPFAKWTQANLIWLMTGVLIHTNKSAQIGSVPSGGRLVPKVQYEHLLKEASKTEQFDSLFTHFECSDEAFAFEIFDGRNEPEFKQGADHVVIDPHLAEHAQPGQMVLAVIDAAPIFAMYVKTDRGQLALRGLNRQWGLEEYRPKRGDKIIGVMTEHAVPGAEPRRLANTP